jgi:ribosome modulation factor
MEAIPWRPADLAAACNEAKTAGKLVLVDFFSPTWGGCAALAKVSYREAAVVATISENFVPVQIDTTEEASAPLVERFRQIWTPDLRVLDPDGFEYDAWQGYWPPAEFIARLLLGRGRALARQHREQEAEAVYGEVLRRFPRSYVAPEAAYWRAVCQYKQTHEPNDLLGGWRRTLHSRYPDSLWRTAQSWSEPPLRE